MSISLVKDLKPFFKLMQCILRYTHEVIRNYLPLVSPTRNLKMTAMAKLTLSPNMLDERPTRSSPTIMTGFRPLRSDIAPHM